MATQSIKVRDLTREQGRPAIGSALSPHRQAVADTLSPLALARMLRDADSGDAESYLTLCEEMEEREPHYASVIATRKLAISGAGLSVRSSDDSADAKAMADDVEATLAKHPDAESLVLDLADGIPKGFSCVEIMWQQDARRWWPREFRYRPQRHFVFDDETLSIPALRSIESPLTGISLDPFKWIYHAPKIRSGLPLRNGICRSVAVCYAAKRWTVADWLAFLDVYGIPIKIGKYPAEDEDKKHLLLQAVAALGSDAAAVIPDTMTVDLLEAAAAKGGATVFAEAAQYWDKQISKVVLGQTMTTDDGSSLAQATIHQQTRYDIRAADARAISATLNRDLVRPYIDLNYGPQKAYPELWVPCEEPENTKTLMETVRTFVSLGGKVQMSEVRDRLGLSEPEEGADLLMPEGAATSTATTPTPPTTTNTPGSGDQGEAAPGDKITTDGQVKELNRQRFDERPSTEDAADLERERKLEHWRPLLDTNVGRLIARVQAAESFDEARELLEELADDEGEVLDVGALVVALARSTFLTRGIGDATDEVDP